MLKKIIAFLSDEIWKIDRKDLSPAKAWGIWILRIILLTIKGVRKSQIQQGASSLTYYTLLGAVPVVAFLFGIARGFLLENQLKTLLLTKFAAQEAVVSQLITFAEASLTLVHKGVIAGSGLVILLWSVMKIMRNIEIVMNQIWEVKNLRSFAKQFSDYLALLFICPIVLIVSSSLTIFLSATLSSIGKLSPIHPLLFFLLNIVSVVLNCGLFTFIYIFIPNTPVRFKPALYAGLITGVFYQVLQALYLSFQIGVSSYNAVYGTFAAFPLFLVWLHMSWGILLLGAKICFAFQNVDAYEFVSDEVDLSALFKKICSLRIAHFSVRALISEWPAPSKVELSKQLHIPLALTTHLLNDLIDGKILVEVKRDGDSESGYYPAIPIDQMTIKRVIDMLDRRGEAIPIPDTHEVAEILKSLEAFSTLIERSDANLPLKSI